jgi:hypothetical protein
MAPLIVTSRRRQVSSQSMKTALDPTIIGGSILLPHSVYTYSNETLYPIQTSEV